MHINELAMILRMNISIRVRIVLLIYYYWPIRIRWIEWMMTCSDISSPPCPSGNKLITISFPSDQIYCIGIGFRERGFGPHQHTVRYADGADTILPVLFHGSTCLRNSNRQLCWFQKKYQTRLAVYNFPDPMGSYHWLLNLWPVIAISGK